MWVRLGSRSSGTAASARKALTVSMASDAARLRLQRMIEYTRRQVTCKRRYNDHNMQGEI